MAHIHEKIDFTVAIFVVHDGKILLIHHRQLDKWLPPISDAVKWYCHKDIQEISDWQLPIAD